jgi:hypothetical protein
VAWDGVCHDRKASQDRQKNDSLSAAGGAGFRLGAAGRGLHPVLDPAPPTQAVPWVSWAWKPGTLETVSRRELPKPARWEYANEDGEQIGRRRSDDELVRLGARGSVAFGLVQPAQIRRRGAELHGRRVGREEMGGWE